MAIPEEEIKIESTEEGPVLASEESPEATPVIEKKIETATSDSPETVTLNKETMDEILFRLNKAEQDMKALLQVQDKNTSNKIEELRNQGKLVKSVKVRKVDGEFVIAYKTIKDEVYFRDGRLIEDQTVQLTYLNGEKRDLTLREWARLGDYATCEVLKESREASGQLFLKVKTEDGQEFDIDVNYVN